MSEHETHERLAVIETEVKQCVLILSEIRNDLKGNGRDIERLKTKMGIIEKVSYIIFAPLILLILGFIIKR